MVGVGFEPTKPKQQILSLSPLTARESNQRDKPFKTPLKIKGQTLRIGIEPMTLRLTVARSNQLS